MPRTEGQARIGRPLRHTSAGATETRTMKDWTAEQIAEASGTQLISPGAARGGPARAVIDSREAGPDALFFGLRGANVDGGRFAAAALNSGPRGALVAPAHAEAAAHAG